MNQPSKWTTGDSLARQPLQKRSVGEHPSNPGALLRSMFTVSSNIPGIQVSHETALTYSAIYACVKVIAETVAMLDIDIYREGKDGTKIVASDHPLHECLTVGWNREQTAFEGCEMIVGHAALRGNAFAQRVWNGAGQTMELWPLHPAYINIMRTRDTRELVYVYSNPVTGEIDYFGRRDILHIRGLMSDGVWGVSPIQMLKSTVEAGLAQDKARSMFFANGVRPSGVFEHPQELGEDAYLRLKEDLQNNNAGIEAYQKPLILEEGMKWHQIGMTAQDAQTVEQGKYTKREVYGAYRMPPHKVGDFEFSSFSNAEQGAIDFASDCIGPWVARIAKAYNYTLLSPQERAEGLIIKISLKKLKEGDKHSTAQANAIARQNGWKNPDEIREEEDLDPIPGGEGKKFLTQMNLAQGGGDFAQPQGGGDKKQSTKQKRDAELYREIVRDQVRQFFRREQKMLEQKAKGSHSAEEWSARFCGVYPELAPVLVDYLRATIRAISDGDAQAEERLASALDFKSQRYGVEAQNEIREVFAGGARPEMSEFTAAYIAKRSSDDAIAEMTDKIVRLLNYYLNMENN